MSTSTRGNCQGSEEKSDMRARERRLNIGDSVVLLLPTENNKLTLAWRGPYEVVEKVGQVDCKTKNISIAEPLQNRQHAQNT